MRPLAFLMRLSDTSFGAGPQVDQKLSSTDIRKIMGQKLVSSYHMVMSSQPLRNWG